MGEMGFVVARYKKIVEIFNYLYSVGAFAEDGTDNIPGYDALSSRIWTSTVGAEDSGSIIKKNAETTMGASIPGYNTNPTVGPVIASLGRFPFLDSSTQDEYDVQFALESDYTENEVLPFAMINEGKIQRTMGDYTLANGHQMKDFYRPVTQG